MSARERRKEMNVSGAINNYSSVSQGLEKNAVDVPVKRHSPSVLRAGGGRGMPRRGIGLETSVGMPSRLFFLNTQKGRLIGWVENINHS
jgi:hypothetical protein